ncbi:hypothetical protein [Frankia sp. AgB32]|uniref:hypothetical protein n=1 Tax=Frankia sp. AgB32 TaxID=631119 RepID=UPI00200E72A1|nr:hypothetical protein [Frankia sp. AgB32]MCK9896989.1 hypothetical protein [Frankia sp. AgB32]
MRLSRFLPWPSRRTVDQHTQQIGEIMADIHDVEARAQRQQADIDTLGGVVDEFTAIVEQLLAGQDTVPADVQAAIDRIVTGLDETAADTEAVTSRLTALAQTAGGTPAPEPTPPPDEPTV